MRKCLYNRRFYLEDGIRKALSSSIPSHVIPPSSAPSLLLMKFAARRCHRSDETICGGGNGGSAQAGHGAVVNSSEKYVDHSPRGPSTDNIHTQGVEERERHWIVKLV